MRRARVGVFDSGVGGLTVLSSCVRAYPHAIFYYLGDNLRAPYGSRPREEVARFTEEALRIFERKGVDAAVIACNTATAACVEEMRRKFPFPVIGMEPAVSPAAKSCKNVLVLATPATAKSERLRGLIARFKGCRFTVYGAEGLAAAIEKKLAGRGELTISDHAPPPDGYDGVVLGCTHYVFFREEFAQMYSCPVFDGNEGTANRLKTVLLKRVSGTDDPVCPRNPNNCLTKNLKKKPKTVLKFLGKTGKMNKRIFHVNICFRKR